MATEPRSTEVKGQPPVQQHPVPLLPQARPPPPQPKPVPTKPPPDEKNEKKE